MLLLCWTSTHPYHLTTTHPGVTQAGSRTSPPLQPLVATVTGRPGAPRWPVLRLWRPAATHSRVYGVGLASPSLCPQFLGLRTRIQTTAWVLPYILMGKATRGGGGCKCRVSHQFLNTINKWTLNLSRNAFAPYDSWCTCWALLCNVVYSARSGNTVPFRSYRENLMW